MATKKRRPTSGVDYMIAFPPHASAGLLQTWQRCKLRYGERIVLLYENGYYFTCEQDALTVAAKTGICQTGAEESAFCYFPAQSLDVILESLGHADQYWVICDSPEDPSQHLFN